MARYGIPGSFDKERNSNRMDSAQEHSKPMGLAIFLRTDTPDYEEVAVPFHSLEEMVRICSEGWPNHMLENVIVHSMIGCEARSLTLSFTSSSKEEGTTILAAP